MADDTTFDPNAEFTDEQYAQMEAALAAKRQRQEEAMQAKRVAFAQPIRKLAATSGYATVRKAFTDARAANEPDDRLVFHVDAILAVFDRIDTELAQLAPPATA